MSNKNSSNKKIVNWDKGFEAGQIYALVNEKQWNMYNAIFGEMKDKSGAPDFEKIYQVYLKTKGGKISKKDKAIDLLKIGYAMGRTMK